MSDNAFGPAGIKSFDFLLRELKSLKTLKVTNCGLGPEGGEMIANALAENTDLKLVQFSAGRDRLENKGITALAGVFKAMGSLEVLEVPQNGIKKDGMIALLESLKANAATLREVYLHDNWIKQEAIDRLVEFILRAKALERLNVSDSTMGTSGALLVAKALSENESVRATLKQFSCNYNEVESSGVSKRILEILGSGVFSQLELVEFKGNTLGRKAANEYISKFEEKGIKLAIFDEEEDEEDEDEEEEADEDEEQGAADEDLIKKLEKLKL